MSKSINHNIQHLIEETSDAFTRYDNMNTDYAAFASMALSEFKTVLKAPDLTAQQLRKILRNGGQKHRALTSNDGSWSSFMAQYVVKNANTNMQDQDTQ